MPGALSWLNLYGREVVRHKPVLIALDFIFEMCPIFVSSLFTYSKHTEKLFSAKHIEYYIHKLSLSLYYDFFGNPSFHIANFSSQDLLK